MELVEGYSHRPGDHCGAGALRNVAAYYGWRYSEAACLGVGGGPAFVVYDRPDEPWVAARTTPTWLERAFFERLGVPHLHRRGDDGETAWGDLTERVDGDDPVVLLLDPSALPYLPDAHVPPHVAVAVGYDDGAVQLSDAAVGQRQTVPRSTLAEAWTHDGVPDIDHEYVVVTRAARTEEGTDAAAAGLRQAATYMLDPLHVKRDAKGPGEEGLPALRSFADAVGRWPDIDEPARPVRAALRSIDEHGEGAAYRGLFAETLAELGQRTGLPPSLADRMEGVADGWRTVADHFEEILERDEPEPATFEAAASLLGDVADREEAVFEELGAELGERRG